MDWDTMSVMSIVGLEFLGVTWTITVHTRHVEASPSGNRRGLHHFEGALHPSYLTNT